MTDQVDYGPLTGLIGRWQGSKGSDLAPEPDGDVTSPYYETLTFTAAGDVDNADSQDLVMLHYHQIVSRQRNDEVFHNETGFIIWDAEQQLLMQSFAIPRGLSLVAGGKVVSSANGLRFELAAGSGDWPIAQAPFLRDNAATESFVRTLELNGDTLSYEQCAVISIYGRRMEHTDTNTLARH